MIVKKKKKNGVLRGFPIGGLRGMMFGALVVCTAFTSTCQTLTNLMPNFSTEISQESAKGDPMERGSHTYFKELEASGQGCDAQSDVIMTIACEKEGIRPCSQLSAWMQANAAKTAEIKKTYCSE